MDLTAAYREVGTYRGAAAMCGRQRCRQCGFQGSLRLFLESAGDPGIYEPRSVSSSSAQRSSEGWFRAR